MIIQLDRTPKTNPKLIPRCSVEFKPRWDRAQGKLGDLKAAQR